MKLAAIDIGSNAMRLLITRIMPGNNTLPEFKKVEFIRIPLRLGDDVFTLGRISDEKKELFLMAINAFRMVMDIHHVTIYKACSTSAMREAANSPQIVKAVEKKFNIHIDVISGAEESRLILKSVLRNLPQKGSFMNIDVGGGSTEITVITDGVPQASESFPIGTVRLMEGVVPGETWKEVEDWVKIHTRKTPGLKALGTGGNISKLYRMGGYSGGRFMPIEVLESLYENISATAIKDRIYTLRLNPDRADVIEHAAKIYLHIMKWAKVKEIMAPQAGLKEGIVLDLWDTLQVTGETS